MPSSATSDIYSLSLHDALPICVLVEVRRGTDVEVELPRAGRSPGSRARRHGVRLVLPDPGKREVQRADERVRRRGAVVHLQHDDRSEEHTSELQSPYDLVCRLLRPPISTLFPYTTLFRSVFWSKFAEEPTLK